MQRRLVERAMQGDQEAFADLASQHIDRCYALAYRILRHQPDAQDATQQALLHLLCQGDHVIEVVVVHDRRVYQIDIFFPSEPTEADRALFDRFLGSFKFDT